jgi:tyrosyl-DNA phosphodiesterase 1
MNSLTRPISPPPRKRPHDSSREHELGPPNKRPIRATAIEDTKSSPDGDSIRVVSSPIRLYSILDLPPSENVDAITLREILSPQSTLDEIWSFNFMTNMQFLRERIGTDDENRVKIRIVHGYWRQEDESRKLMEAGVWGPNVKLISAYLPDPYGTHHSKVIILFRTDDTAQVVVHTGINSPTVLI